MTKLEPPPDKQLRRETDHLVRQRRRATSVGSKATSKRRRASSRRTQSAPAPASPVPRRLSTLIIGPLLLDRTHHAANVYGRSIHFTPREFALLWALALRPGKVYGREELLTAVWGHGVFVSDRTVDVHMAKVRAKLRVRGDRPDLVETIWGVGYRLRLESQ